MREFGYDWEPRVGNLGAGSPWSAQGITRYTGLQHDHMPTRRRMAFNATDFSAGVKLLQPQGYGEFLIYGEGRLECLPIDAVVGIWLYDDRPGAGGGTEVDFESTRWRDTNQANGIWLGVHNNQLHTMSLRDREEAGELAKAPHRGFYHWRVRITTRPGEARVAYEGWQPFPGAWKEAAAGLFIAPNTEFSTLRLGCWQDGPLTTRGAMQARLTVAGVEFTPLEIK